MASGYLNTLPKNIERRKDISNLGDKMKNKKAMIGSLIGLGIGIFVIAVIMTIGIVVMGNFASSQASCSTGLAYNETLDTCYREYCKSGTILNTSYSLYSDTPCQNLTSNITCCPQSQNFTISTEASTAAIGAQSAHYAAVKMGNGTGGFLTWLPVIIPAIIGIGIIGYFMTMRVKA